MSDALVPSSGRPAPLVAKDAGELHVLFRVGDVALALPASVVLQMESFSGATAVPGAPPFVLGIVQLRGRVVPVVDLRVRFGLAPVPPTQDARVVVGEHGGRAVALLADSAREVARIASEAVEPPPPVLAGGAGRFVSGIAHIGERTVLLLDFAKVIGEDLHG